MGSPPKKKIHQIQGMSPQGELLAQRVCELPLIAQLGLRNSLGFRYEELEGMRAARGLHACPPFRYLKRNLFLNYLRKLYFLLF
jgi:hypothetical protein